MKKTARIPASCGEFIEGRVLGVESLISNTINLFEEITVMIDEPYTEANILNKKAYRKIRTLIENFLRFINDESLFERLQIVTSDSIPRSKGYASSTAQLSGTLWALCSLLNIDLNFSDAAKLLTKIDATDSTIFKELTLFDNMNGSKWETLGAFPEIPILAFEEEKGVNTMVLKRKKWYRASIVDKTFELFAQGVKERDFAKMATACEESALKNQKNLRKPYLEEMIVLTRKLGLLGLNIAHSGSVIAIWCEETTDLDKIEKHYIDRLGRYFVRVRRLRTTHGGVRLIED